MDIRGTPTPRIKGNLPSDNRYDDWEPSQGHQVPAPPMQWYERANPRTEGGGSLKVGPWEPVPSGVRSDVGGLTKDDLNALHRQNPDYYPEYRMGGAIRTTYAAGGTAVAAPPPPLPSERDPRAQLSAGYWDRVARQAAIDRAAVGGTPAGDARARAIDDYLGPPGPRPGAPPGAAYAGGGKAAAEPPPPNYDKWASDPERWSRPSPGSPPDPEQLDIRSRADQARRGLPSFAGGGFMNQMAAGLSGALSGSDPTYKPKPKTPDPNAGVPGSNDAAVDAAVKYGPAPVDPAQAAPSAPVVSTDAPNLSGTGDIYAGGGAIRTRSYADGGFVPRIQSFQGGGQMTQMPAWGYDPSQYVSTATNWADTQNQNQGQTYQWAKDQFNNNEGTANNVISSALQQGNTWGDAANAGLSRYESMYAPAMAQQLQYAQQYASPENLALYRGQAMAGVGQAFDKQADAAAQSLRSYGLNPTSVASRLDSTVRTQRAAAEAGAGTQSDINNKLVGQQLLGGAIQTGQQDQQLSGQMAGVSQAARNQAVNTGLATTASGSATMGTPTQWASLANTELQQWPAAQLAGLNAQTAYGNEWNNINQTSLQAQKQQEDQSGGAGALIGAGLGALTKLAPMAMAAEDGAVIPKFAAGGEVTPGVSPPAQAIQTGNIVPPSAEVAGIPGKDKVPALVGKGEGVLPLDVMEWIGEKGFQALIAKTRQERQRQTQAEGKPAHPMAAAMAQQAGPQFMSGGPT